MLVKIKVDPTSPQRINALLEGLVRLASVDLANNPQIPPLYSGAVRYRREKPDLWSPPSDVLKRGYGDCEDLAAWLCAQRRSQGKNCRAVAYKAGNVGRKRLWHVVVQYPDGRVEDPSKMLGMKGGA